MAVKAKRKYTKRIKTGEQNQQRKKYEMNARVVDAGVPCTHCGERYNHKVVNTYPNGNRRRICGECGKPFVSMRIKDAS